MKYPTVTALALTAGNILGPLFLFGGIGWYLTDLYDNKWYVIGGIFIAFILSNLLIVTTTTKYLRFASEYKKSTSTPQPNAEHKSNKSIQ